MSDTPILNLERERQRRRAHTLARATSFLVLSVSFLATFLFAVGFFFGLGFHLSTF